MSAMMLTEEMKLYRAKLAELVESSRGKFVLIHGDRIVGTYANIDEALVAGYEAFGNAAFFVKQVQPAEPPSALNFSQSGA